jgi:hypothetical protein
MASKPGPLTAGRSLARRLGPAGRVSDEEISGFGRHQQHQYRRYGEEFVYGEGFWPDGAYKFTES